MLMFGTGQKKKKDKRDEINMPFSYQIFRVSYKKWNMQRVVVIKYYVILVYIYKYIFFYMVL